MSQEMTTTTHWCSAREHCFQVRRKRQELIGSASSFPVKNLFSTTCLLLNGKHLTLATHRTNWLSLKHDTMYFCELIICTVSLADYSALCTVTMKHCRLCVVTLVLMTVFVPFRNSRLITCKSSTNHC